MADTRSLDAACLHAFPHSPVADWIAQLACRLAAALPRLLTGGRKACDPIPANAGAQLPVSDCAAPSDQAAAPAAPTAPTAGALQRRKDYCRALCRLVLRSGTPADAIEVAESLEFMAKELCAISPMESLHAAAYQVRVRHVLGKAKGIEPSWADYARALCRVVLRYCGALDVEQITGTLQLKLERMCARVDQPGLRAAACDLHRRHILNAPAGLLQPTGAAPGADIDPDTRRALLVLQCLGESGGEGMLVEALFWDMAGRCERLYDFRLLPLLLALQQAGQVVLFDSADGQMVRVAGDAAAAAAPPTEEEVPDLARDQWPVTSVRACAVLMHKRTGARPSTLRLSAALKSALAAHHEVAMYLPTVQTQPASDEQLMAILGVQQLVIDPALADSGRAFLVNA